MNIIAHACSCSALFFHDFCLKAQDILETQKGPCDISKHVVKSVIVGGQKCVLRRYSRPHSCRRAIEMLIHMHISY
jgi:hypothetical protein